MGKTPEEVAGGGGLLGGVAAAGLLWRGERQEGWRLHPVLRVPWEEVNVRRLGNSSPCVVRLSTGISDLSVAGKRN
jgi:hypothetical protein